MAPDGRYIIETQVERGHGQARRAVGILISPSHTWRKASTAAAFALNSNIMIRYASWIRISMRPLAVGASARAGIAQAIKAAYAMTIVTRVIVDVRDGRRQGMYAIRDQGSVAGKGSGLRVRPPCRSRVKRSAPYLLRNIKF